jgi:hypothetical protein
MREELQGVICMPECGNKGLPGQREWRNPKYEPMTRAEILESLHPYPENILRGSVTTLEEFIEWMRVPMTIGSDQKVWQCDLASCTAFAKLVFTHPRVFRSFIKIVEPEEIEIWFAMPFGFAKIEVGEQFEGITIFDNGILKTSIEKHPGLASAQGYSETIRDIRI